MAFTNTVDSVGDAALTRSIIDRSITELNCNITTSVRQYAFRACSALANVNFPSVTQVALGAFWQCSALAKAEFSSAVAFANNAFYGCSALTALILRSTDQLCTISGTPFASSAIASGTGYIYVPAALVDQYKASWTAYASQIRAIEDYPGVADAYSWAGVAANIADGSYKSVYKIGDLVPLDLGSEGLINMQIAAFDADDLADGTGKAPISWISKELLATRKRFNPASVTNSDGTYQVGTGNIGGWEQSELRAYMKETIKPLIPENVRRCIVNVSKTQYALGADGAGFTQTTTDDVWIPTYNSNKYNTEYADLFPNEASRIKYLVGVDGSKDWWLRSAIDYANNTECFVKVDSAGNIKRTIASNGSTNKLGIALGFCT